jgi:hypothetical protein
VISYGARLIAVRRAWHGTIEPPGSNPQLPSRAGALLKVGVPIELPDASVAPDLIATAFPRTDPTPLNVCPVPDARLAGKEELGDDGDVEVVAFEGEAG